MSRQNKYKEQPKIWQSQDPRLLRAALRIIRLYDMKQAKLMTVKAESVSEIIAEELNENSNPLVLTD